MRPSVFAALFATQLLVLRAASAPCAGSACFARDGGASLLQDHVSLLQARVSLLPRDSVLAAPAETAPEKEVNGRSFSSGTHSLDQRKFIAEVPAGKGPFPVLIVLHGRGVSAQFTMDKIKDSIAGIASAYIVVAPDGYKDRWNIMKGMSPLDDTTFVGNTLLDHLCKFPNVEPDFKFFGHSNGAGLTNKLLIESDDPRISGGVTSNGQLIDFQYHDSSFYVGGPELDYTKPKTSLTPRKFLQLTGGSDTTVPASGGMTHTPVSVPVLPWEESAFRYAQAYGYVGPRASLAEDSDTFSRVNYLDGQVQAYHFKSAGHVSLVLGVPGASEPPVFAEPVSAFLDVDI